MTPTNEDWMQVLDRIDTALRTSLAQIVDPPHPAPLANLALDTLHALDQRMVEWQRRLTRTEDRAREAADLLSAEQTALEQCQTELADLRERLGRWATRPEPGAESGPASAGGSGAHLPGT
ncbi:MAG: hypothetical protein U0840_29020 [Gemmataceae bacterium]